MLGELVTSRVSNADANMRLRCGFCVGPLLIAFDSQHASASTDQLIAGDQVIRRPRCLCFCPAQISIHPRHKRFAAFGVCVELVCVPLMSAFCSKKPSLRPACTLCLSWHDASRFLHFMEKCMCMLARITSEQNGALTTHTRISQMVIDQPPRRTTKPA